MKRRHLILLACCAGSFIAGMAWPPPPIPAAREDSTDWVPPSAAVMSRYTQEAFTQAGQIRWQADLSTTAGVGDLTSVKWRLAGLLENPDAHAIVLQPGIDQSVSRLETGAILPDGSRLVEIVDNTITVELGDCRRVYKMHYSEPVRSSGSCGPSNTD